MWLCDCSSSSYVCFHGTLLARRIPTIIFYSSYWHRDDFIVHQYILFDIRLIFILILKEIEHFSEAFTTLWYRAGTIAQWVGVFALQVPRPGSGSHHPCPKPDMATCSPISPKL